MAKTNNATNLALVKAIITNASKIRELARESKTAFDESGKCNDKVLSATMLEVPQIAENIASIARDILVSVPEAKDVKPTAAVKPATK